MAVAAISTALDRPGHLSVTGEIASRIVSGFAHARIRARNPKSRRIVLRTMLPGFPEIERKKTAAVIRRSLQ
jgi:hypothetical protein